MTKLYCAYRRPFIGAACSASSSASTYQLSPCADRLQLSPVLFDWSDSEAGAYHLSFAILADWFGNDAKGRRCSLGDCLAACLYQRFQTAYLCHKPHKGFVLTSEGLRSILRPLAMDHREPLVIAFSQLAASELARARAVGRCPGLPVLRAQYSVALLASLRCGVPFINTLFAEAHLDELYYQQEAVA
jgi:hypothetical protein